MSASSLYVHLGAHRTGSSSFQQYLGLNRSKLEAQGVSPVYPIRDGAIGGFSGKFRFPSENPNAPPENRLFKNYVKPLRTKLQSLIDKKAERVLISEENLLGRMGFSFREGFTRQQTTGCRYCQKRFKCQSTMP